MTLDIMMPFYGDVDLFKDAVRSVLAQTDPDWRLVVIDDRYPDDEPKRYLDELADSRIQYVLNPENLGVSGNFQRAIDLATADFVTIMGCDDILLPRYVSRVRELVGHSPEAAYFQPGVQVIDGAGALTLPLGDRVKAHYRPAGTAPLLLSGEDLAASLLRGNWTYFPSLCWRRDELRRHGFRQDYTIVLDLALQLQIVRDGGILVLDDQPVFQYRRHASVSSWSGSGLERFEEERTLFQESAAASTELGWRRARRAARLHLTSRLNAAVHIPQAIAARGVGLGGLLRHVFGS